MHLNPPKPVVRLGAPPACDTTSIIKEDCLKRKKPAFSSASQEVATTPPPPLQAAKVRRQSDEPILRLAQVRVQVEKIPEEEKADKLKAGFIFGHLG